MNDDMASRIEEPASWRQRVGFAGWIVLVVVVIGVALLVLESLRAGVGQALHADSASTERSFESLRRGTWLVFAGAASSLVLAIVGRRWVLTVLAALLFLFAGVLTQGRFGA